MSTLRTCPEPARLQQLLNQALSGDEQALLMEHLERTATADEGSAMREAANQLRPVRIEKFVKERQAWVEVFRDRFPPDGGTC